MIAGASGMIGKIILALCLENKEVGKITSIVRKPSGIQNKKLIEVVHDNFLHFSNIESFFKNQDICFYCIGVYTGAVCTNEFKKVTVDYTRTFASTLKKMSTKVRFCFLSGQGADLKENSKILFAKQKGIAENILIKLNFEELHIFRPGYIYPITKRVEPNMMYRILRIMYKPLSFIYPNIGCASTQLGNTMYSVGLRGNSKMIFENVDIRKYVS